MEDDGVAPATADNEYRMIKTMFTMADDDDRINPACIKAFRGIRKASPKGANVRKTTITLHELRKIYESSDDMFQRILIIALITGMRGGEIRGLTPNHTDMQRETDKTESGNSIQGWIKLGPDDTKEFRTKDNPKLIPITPTIGKALSDSPRHICTPHYFYTAEGKKILEFGIVSRMRSSCRRAGIPYGRKTPNGVTFHDIRRTTKTLMEKVGIRKSIRDAILGHSANDMDRHYIHPSNEDITRAMLDFEAWLLQRWESCTPNCTPIERVSGE